MFLTRGYIQHHDTWELWFKDVQGSLPLSAMQVPYHHLPFVSPIKPRPLCNYQVLSDRRQSPLRSQPAICPWAGNIHLSLRILWQQQRLGATLPTPACLAACRNLLPCYTAQLLGCRLEPRGFYSQAEGCTADAISAAGHSCGMSGGPQILHQQHLFSVLTHIGAGEGFKGAPRGFMPSLSPARGPCSAGLCRSPAMP